MQNSLQVPAIGSGIHEIPRTSGLGIAHEKVRWPVFVLVKSRTFDFEGQRCCPQMWPITRFNAAPLLASPRCRKSAAIEIAPDQP